MGKGGLLSAALRPDPRILMLCVIQARYGCWWSMGGKEVLEGSAALG